ncbi:hypothetical protein COCSADRAFT_220010 [Bipolaris sorokiniana ND90Pr]|uniref:Secreted protein n=1 Tax=Cochliobolus sativus (strain ND90Pr / ATCC 201652) TaxID=665912 RepID=M2SZI6_COCSN|nr:uncharacterized protein COCSADRAFT_220010 [Bipolaris sorokiniana ND90Pr]EMD62361.1 hypothetical protein COCSADRAFT_220010 [Bipolaris sorokiniana ND90Pr]
MRLVGWRGLLRLLLHFGPVRVCAQLCRSLRAQKSHTEGLFSQPLRRAGRNGPVVFGIEHVVRSVAMTGDHHGFGRGRIQKLLRHDGNLHTFAHLAYACHMCKDADAPLDASLAPVLHACIHYVHTWPTASPPCHRPYQPKCARNTMLPLVKTLRC